MVLGSFLFIAVGSAMAPLVWCLVCEWCGGCTPGPHSVLGPASLSDKRRWEKEVSQDGRSAAPCLPFIWVAKQTIECVMVAKLLLVRASLRTPCILWNVYCLLSVHWGWPQGTDPSASHLPHVPGGGGHTAQPLHTSNCSSALWWSSAVDTATHLVEQV